MNFSNFRSGAIFTSATYTSREWVLIKFIHCDLIFEFPRKIMEYVIFASAFVRISFGLPQPSNASISWHYDGTQLVNTQSNVSITAMIPLNCGNTSWPCINLDVSQFYIYIDDLSLGSIIVYFLLAFHQIAIITKVNGTFWSSRKQSTANRYHVPKVKYSANSFSFTQFKFIFNCFLMNVNVLLCKSTSPFFCYLWVWRKNELSV